jgi:DNA invertase Pin-like site-specific DNA recombinase
MPRAAIFLGKTADAEHLAGIVGGRGGQIVGVYAAGRYRRGWKDLPGDLDTVDTVLIEAVDDLPVRSVAELLSALAGLNEAGVSLYVAATGIDTLTSPATCLLELLVQSQRMRRSKAIRQGQPALAPPGRKSGGRGFRRSFDSGLLKPTPLLRASA